MDIASIAALSTAIATLLGGFVYGRQNALSGAASINQILQSRITDLEDRAVEKDALIVRMTGKIETLEGMVAQRARVEELHVKVDAVSTRVDAIATKVGA